MRQFNASKRIEIIFGILFIVSTTHSIDVYLNNELRHFNSPYSRYGRVEFNITGAGLAVADPIDLCIEQRADYTNKIVLAVFNGCSPLTKIRLAQERGAVGIIVQETSSPGIAGKTYWKTADGRWAPETSLPFVTLNTPDGDLLKSLILNATSNDTLSADLDPFDESIWVDVLDTSNAYMGLSISLILANGAGLGFALSRLISLIIAQGCHRTTAHLTLALICAMHASTIVYYVTNIIDIKVGPIAPDIFYTIFLVLPELFQMLSSLVVSLYWFELINSVTSKPMMFLKKLFKPFIAFAVIISALYVALVVLSGLYIGDLVLLIFLFVFFLLSLAVAIIWLIVGGKLIYQIRTNARLRENKKQTLNFNRLSALIILCGIFLLLTRAMYLVLALDIGVYLVPWNWIPVASLIFSFQLITAFIQTGLFKFHKRDFKSTSKGSERDRATADSQTSYRASTHGGMHMSALATKGESVHDTLSEEQLLSGAETGRTATTAETAESRVQTSRVAIEEFKEDNTKNSDAARDTGNRKSLSEESQHLDDSKNSSQSEQEEHSSIYSSDSGSESESS